MSTTITEQKNKAKYIIQTFAQITDFVVTGNKSRIETFNHHKCMKDFDRIFEQVKDEALLYKIGFNEKASKALLENKQAVNAIRKFRKVFSYFEAANSVKGKYNISDGVTCDAIFCIRDVLREMPVLMKDDKLPIADKEFVDILKSNYATKKDLVIHRGRSVKIREFQKQYEGLIDKAVKLLGEGKDTVLGEIITRSSLINRYDRITGDAIISVAKKMIRNRNSIPVNERHRLMTDFIIQQIVRPEFFEKHGRLKKKISNKKAKSVYSSMVQDVKDCSEGI
jgi:hypothetical protein